MHIIGAGGHARVIIEILLESNTAIAGVWDENPELISILGQPVKGNFESFLKAATGQCIIAIGNNRIRKRISDQLEGRLGRAIHPGSVVSKSSLIGAGSVVMANATVNANAILGAGVIVNTNASVDHECKLGDYVHISPQVGLGGNVEVGEGTHIGIGASVIHGIKIGKWATIGAGTVVIKDVPDYAVVVGNPGRIIKYNKPSQ